MRIYYYRAFIIKIYDLGFSFLPLYKAKSETLATLTTLKRIPEMSPTWSLWPNPASRTSSFSSIKSKQPSLGTKAVIFFFFFGHYWLAEPWHTSWWMNLAVWLQLLLFQAPIPLAGEVPPEGLAFRAVPKWAFLYCWSCHFWPRQWPWSLLAVWRLKHLSILLAPWAWAHKKTFWCVQLWESETPINWSLSFTLLNTTTDASLRYLIPRSLFCLWICLRIPQVDGILAAVTRPPTSKPGANFCLELIFLLLHTPIRTTKMKRKENINCWWGCRATNRNSHTLLVGM